MITKKLFLISFIFLVIFLNGCNGAITPANDEAKVRSVIQDYYLAINDQNWGKAKNYCIYGSEQYYKVSLMEDTANTVQQYYGAVTITCFADISNIAVTGNYASAYINVIVLVTAGYYYDSFSDSGYLYLQKVGNNWKLY